VTVPTTTPPTSLVPSPPTSETSTVPDSTPTPSGIPTGIGEPDASGQGPVFWFFILMVGVSGGIVGGLGVRWWAKRRHP
jgi:hypothetical protein